MRWGLQFAFRRHRPRSPGNTGGWALFFFYWLYLKEMTTKSLRKYSWVVRLARGLFSHWKDLHTLEKVEKEILKEKGQDIRQGRWTGGSATRPVLPERSPRPSVLEVRAPPPGGPREGTSHRRALWPVSGEKAREGHTDGSCFCCFLKLLQRKILNMPSCHILG